MFSGMSGASILVILLIVVLVFGTKKLKNLGSDVGGAVKGFRKAMHDEDPAEPALLPDDSHAKQNTSQSSEVNRN